VEPAEERLTELGLSPETGEPAEAAHETAGGTGSRRELPEEEPLGELGLPVEDDSHAVEPSTEPAPEAAWGAQAASASVRSEAALGDSGRDGQGQAEPAPSRWSSGGQAGGQEPTGASVYHRGAGAEPEVSGSGPDTLACPEPNGPPESGTRAG
jgi:hypothetical protein